MTAALRVSCCCPVVPVGAGVVVPATKQGALPLPVQVTRPVRALGERTVELSETPWQASFLDTIPSKSTLERILRNLLNAASEAGEPERMLRYTEAVLVLNPNSAQDHMFRGILSFQTGRWQQANAEIDWLKSHESNISRKSIEDLSRAIRDAQK